MSQEPVAAATVIGASGTAAGATGTVLTSLHAAAEAIFGIPLQVVFACATASFGAMTFLGHVGAWRMISASLFYTAIGSFTVPLGMHLLGAPSAAAAGVGAIISGALPFMMPKIRERLPQVVEALFDKITGKAPPPK